MLLTTTPPPPRFRIPPVSAMVLGDFTLLQLQWKKFAAHSEFPDFAAMQVSEIRVHVPVTPVVLGGVLGGRTG